MQTSYTVLEQNLLNIVRDLCNALEEIKERRLYRSTHPSFAAYCRDRGLASRLRKLEETAKELGVDLSRIGYKNPIEEA